MNFFSFSDEFLKLSAVTRDEAEASLSRLRKLEETKPTLGEIGRGALAGSAAGTASVTASNLASGKLVKGVRAAMKAPTWGGRVAQMGKSVASNVGGGMAGSAAFGATLPLVRRHLDRESEKEKLRQYLGQSRRGYLTGEVKKTLGV